MNVVRKIYKPPKIEPNIIRKTTFNWAEPLETDLLNERGERSVFIKRLIDKGDLEAAKYFEPRIQEKKKVGELKEAKEKEELKERLVKKRQAAEILAKERLIKRRAQMKEEREKEERLRREREVRAELERSEQRRIRGEQAERGRPRTRSLGEQEILTTRRGLRPSMERRRGLTREQERRLQASAERATRREEAARAARASEASRRAAAERAANVERMRQAASASSEQTEQTVPSYEPESEPVRQRERKEPEQKVILQPPPPYEPEEVKFIHRNPPRVIDDKNLVKQDIQKFANIMKRYNIPRNKELSTFREFANNSFGKRGLAGYLETGNKRKELLLDQLVLHYTSRISTGQGRGAQYRRFAPPHYVISKRSLGRIIKNKKLSNTEKGIRDLINRLKKANKRSFI